MTKHHNELLPLIQREFPEEEMLKLLCRFEVISMGALNQSKQSSVLEEIKRLWEGKATREGDNILEQDESYGERRGGKERRTKSRRRPQISLGNKIAKVGRRNYDELLHEDARNAGRRRIKDRRENVLSST